jgi:hypothetical protein
MAAVKAKTACVTPDAKCFTASTCDQTWLKSSGQTTLTTAALQTVWESEDATFEKYVEDNRDDRCDQLKILDNIHRSWHYLDSSTCKCGNYSMGGGNFLCLRASLF